MSAIGDLAALLAVQGLSADVVRSIVDLAQQHAVEVSAARPSIGGLSSDIVRASADSAVERRKKYDRDRQAEIRRLKRLEKKPPLILTSSSSESKKLTEIESKKERRARVKKGLGPLPENWLPPDIAYPLAIECGTTVPQVDAIFRDYLKSSGKLYADHDAAFCNFVRNQRKFNGQPQGQANGRRTVHDAANDLDRHLKSLQEPAPDGLCGGAGQGPLRLISPR
jgi:hypothetical protein